MVKVGRSKLIYYIQAIIPIGLICLPHVVFATDSGSMEYTVCSVVDALTGNIARSFAAIAVIFLGFSLFLGKISWGIALALAIGIGTVFGAPEIVSVLAGDGKGCETVLASHGVSPSGSGKTSTSVLGGTGTGGGITTDILGSKGLTKETGDSLGNSKQLAVKPLEGQIDVPVAIVPINVPDTIDINGVESPGSAASPKEVPPAIYMPVDVPLLHYYDPVQATPAVPPPPADTEQKQYIFEPD